jgi:hypothetical protein
MVGKSAPCVSRYCGNFRREPGFQIRKAAMCYGWRCRRKFPQYRLTHGADLPRQLAPQFAQMRVITPAAQQKLRRELARQISAMRQSVLREFPPGTRVSDPEGGRSSSATAACDNTEVPMVEVYFSEAILRM